MYSDIFDNKVADFIQGIYLLTNINFDRTVYANRPYRFLVYSVHHVCLKKIVYLHCTLSRTETFNGTANEMWWTKQVSVALWWARRTLSSLASFRAPTFWSRIVSVRFSAWYGTSGASSKTDDPRVNSQDNDGFGLPSSTTHETVRSAFSFTGMKGFPGSSMRLSIMR